MGWANIPSYFEVTTRYSQLLYDTDIVLLAPTGSAVATRASIIRDADQPQDVTISSPMPDEFRSENYKYSPTVKIIGGRIYVGENHTLDIEGGREVTNSSTNVTVNTLTVSPTSITVASGGALNLLLHSGAGDGIASVNTDIFVSGEMTMQSGAKAKGNIIVNEGGAVTIGGSDPSIPTYYEGIIYVTSGGSLTIGTGANTTGNIYVSAGGNLYIKSGCIITGDVFCAGNLDVAGGFELKYDPNLDPDETSDRTQDESRSHYIKHGIFLYSGPGTRTLTFDGATTVPSLPTIGGNSGRVHTFRGEPGYTDNTGSESKGVFFCYDNDTSNHICKHWQTEVKTWIKQNDSKSVAE
jgi:hypothetical protein